MSFPVAGFLPFRCDFFLDPEFSESAYEDIFAGLKGLFDDFEDGHKITLPVYLQFGNGVSVLIVGVSDSFNLSLEISEYVFFLFPHHPFAMFETEYRKEFPFFPIISMAPI